MFLFWMFQSRTTTQQTKKMSSFLLLGFFFSELNCRSRLCFKDCLIYSHLYLCSVSGGWNLLNCQQREDKQFQMWKLHKHKVWMFHSSFLFWCSKMFPSCFLCLCRVFHVVLLTDWEHGENLYEVWKLLLLNKCLNAANQQTDWTLLKLL